MINIKTISVFCDYAADGLWVDGASDDLEGLCKDINIPFDPILNIRIRAWQDQYEEWDFFSGKVSYDTIYATPEFKAWNAEGLKIAKVIRDIVPGEIEVEYLDEKTGQRTKLNKGGG